MNHEKFRSARFSETQNTDTQTDRRGNFIYIEDNISTNTERHGTVSRERLLWQSSSVCSDTRRRRVNEHTLFARIAHECQDVWWFDVARYMLRSCLCLSVCHYLTSSARQYA